MLAMPQKMSFKDFSHNLVWRTFKARRANMVENCYDGTRIEQISTC